jgi:hypothetical protein
MKQHLFLYLFSFALLVIVFQYVNSKNIIDKYERDIKELKSKVKIRDSLNLQLSDENFELSQFTLSANEEAMAYFEYQNYRISQLEPAIMDALYETNVYDGEEHPLIPYVSMTDRPILLDEARIINHRWILANYTDGAYFGEVFLNYNVVNQDSITFKLNDYVLFPKF